MLVGATMLILLLAVICLVLTVDNLDQRQARGRAERECARYRRRAREFFVR